MFLRKKKDANLRARVRPLSPNQPPARAGGPVFSYYAKRRSIRTENTHRGGAFAALDGNVVTAKDPLKRQRNTHWRRRLYSFSTLALILLLIAATLRLDAQPKMVTVDLAAKKQLFLRDRAVYQRAATQLFARSMLNKNKLTVNTNSIATDLQHQFPELTAVTISLPVVGAQPVVYVQPALPKLVLATKSSGMYLLDKHGRALLNATEVPDLQGLGIPVVSDESGVAIREGQLALPASSVAFIAEVAGQLAAQHIEVTSFTLPAGANELYVRPAGVPYFVKYNIHGNAREEAGAYIATKQKLEAEHVQPKEYVDVRLENRVFFK